MDEELDITLEATDLTSLLSKATLSRNNENIIASLSKDFSKEVVKIISDCFVAKNLSCPISFDIMSDPVSLFTQAGPKYLFERRAIEASLRGKAINPMSREPASKADLFEEDYLKCAIDHAVFEIAKLPKDPDFLILAKQFDSAADDPAEQKLAEQNLKNKINSILDKAILAMERQREIDVPTQSLVLYSRKNKKQDESREVDAFELQFPTEFLYPSAEYDFDSGLAASATPSNTRVYRI